nr:zinc-dependent metalloprotease [Kineosphaera limosa]
MRRMFEQFLGDADNPAMSEALKSMGIDNLDPATMQMIASQLTAMFATEPTDGINLELSTDMARKTVAAAGDALVDDAQRKAVRDAVGVADLWLDEVTSFTRPGGPALAWSRAEWVDQTMPVWGQLVGPVATAVTDAITGALRGQLDRLGESGEMPELPGGMPGMPGLPAGMDFSTMINQFEPMLGRMSSSMFGAQIGQAVGNLAGEVVSGTEVGLPLVPGGGVALLPANVAKFAEGLDVDDTQVLLYLAVREVARARLFADVPWLGPQLLAAVQAYAADISVDTDGIEAKLSTIDPTDPQAVQEALAGGLFTPDPSPAQKRALERLETLLALVEGWVDVVVARATERSLPQSAGLGEMVRRRRATGGPAEQLFSQLVGLQLRPRRLRDAANLFAALEKADGAAMRDRAWGHPDVAPTAEDLDDILGYVERLTGRRAESIGAGEGGASGPDTPAGTAPTAPQAGDAQGSTSGMAGDAGESSDRGDLDDMDAALARLIDEETRGDDPKK